MHYVDQIGWATQTTLCNLDRPLDLSEVDLGFRLGDFPEWPSGHGGSEIVGQEVTFLASATALVLTHVFLKANLLPRFFKINFDL